MHWLGETLVTSFNFPIMVIASAAFVTRALDSTIFLELSASRQLFTIFFITKVQACVRTAAAYLHFFVISLVIIVYVFVFQNIIIEGRNFYVFTIFRVSQLVFVPLKRLLYLEFSVQNFLLPTANLLIIPGTLFCLSPVMVSIIPHGADDFHLLKHDLKLLFFSYSDATMTPGFDQKVKKKFFAYLYLHLTLPPSDRMMD